MFFVSFFNSLYNISVKGRLLYLRYRRRLQFTDFSHIIATLVISYTLNSLPAKINIT